MRVGLLVLMTTMSPSNDKAEKYLRTQGRWVALPINLMLILSPRDICVLSCIRHCLCANVKHISNSVLSDMTGLAESTINLAKVSLSSLGLLNIQSSGNGVLKYGAIYSINYDLLCDIVYRLNNAEDPAARLVLANTIKSQLKDNKTLNII